MKRHYLLLYLAAGLIAAQSTDANAAVTVTITQNGPDVVAVTSGAFFGDLTFVGSNSNAVDAGITPSIASFAAATIAPNSELLFTGLTGPTDFGDGAPTDGSAFVGDAFYFSADLRSLGVPVTYILGRPISATTTFANSTFASLGLYPGSYVYTSTLLGNYGTPEVTVNIVAGAVPEPATWAMMLLGFAGMGFAMRRKQSQAIARTT